MEVLHQYHPWLVNSLLLLELVVQERHLPMVEKPKEPGWLLLIVHLVHFLLSLYNFSLHSVIKS